jgi:hypothetical protein
MLTNIIGDLHGKVEVVKHFLARENERIVFTGDFLDSYDHSVQDQLATLELVLDACEQRPEQVVALMGNHEMSYLRPEYRASGFSIALDSHLIPLKGKMWRHLQRFTWVDGILVTHAGVCMDWLNRFCPTCLGVTRANTELLTEFLFECELSAFAEIGDSRGGFAPSGGPLWCDFYDDFVPLPSITQVFGHTARREYGDDPGVLMSPPLGRSPRAYLIDCLDRTNEYVQVQDGIIHIRGFDI